MSEHPNTTNHFNKTEAEMALDNMKAAVVATLTESELWARFVASRVQTTYSMGPTVDSYCPDDLLSDPGVHGTTGEFARSVSDELSQVEGPAAALDCVIEDLASYLDGLRMVRDAFTSVKKSLIVHAVDDAEDGEVRYRAPAVQKGEAA